MTLINFNFRFKYPARKVVEWDESISLCIHSDYQMSIFMCFFLFFFFSLVYCNQISNSSLENLEINLPSLLNVVVYNLEYN